MENFFVTSCLRGSNSLLIPADQFKIIPKRISKMKPLVIRDLRLLGDLPAFIGDFFSPGDDVIDLIRDVRTRLSFDVVFHANVDLECAGVEPDAFAGEDRGPWDFSQAEEAQV